MLNVERKICTQKTSKPTVPLSVLVDRILVLAQAMAEKEFYLYQYEFCYRVVEAVLLHDGDMLTACFSRQSGKSECVADTLDALMVILPALSNSPMFADDWRFNLTDDLGRYRGFKAGVMIGVYGPKQEQADIIFSRLKSCVETDTCQSVLKELGIQLLQCNANRVRMSNGSFTRAETASEQSKIEGDSYHILVLDEAQDINTTKVRKSLHPMVAAYNGVIIKVGTPSIQKSDFYTSIKTNERIFAQGGPRNHYQYDYTVCGKHNSLYAAYIEKEKVHLGEDSDEFKLSYKCQWLLERGQFVTADQLLSPKVAKLTGEYSTLWRRAKRFGYQVAGIDFGKIHDPTVVTVLDVDWNNPIFDDWVDTPERSIHFTAYQKHIVGWLQLLGDNYEEQFVKITEYLSRFSGLRKITLDATGVGQWGYDKFSVHYASFNRGLTAGNVPEYDQVVVEGINFSSPQIIADGYKILHTDICTGRITFPASKITQTTAEFRKFVGEMLDLRKTFRNGHMRCEAPDEPGAHDDFPTSAMLACISAQVPVDTGFEVALGRL